MRDGCTTRADRAQRKQSRHGESKCSLEVRRFQRQTTRFRQARGLHLTFEGQGKVLAKDAVGGFIDSDVGAVLTMTKRDSFRCFLCTSSPSSPERASRSRLETSPSVPSSSMRTGLYHSTIRTSAKYARTCTHQRRMRLKWAVRFLDKPMVDRLLKAPATSISMRGDIRFHTHHQGIHTVKTATHSWVWMVSLIRGTICR